jgi:hypothetical protein
MLPIGLRLCAILLIGSFAISSGGHGQGSAQPSQQDQASKDQAAKDQAAKDQAAKDQAAAKELNKAAENTQEAAKKLDAAADKTGTAAKKLDDAADKTANGAERAQRASAEAQDAAENVKQATEKMRQAKKDMDLSLARLRAGNRAKATKHPLDDFVPCMFDTGQELELRARGSSSNDTLSPEEADLFSITAKAVVQSVSATETARAKTTNAPDSSDPNRTFLANVQKSLAEKSFAGAPRNGLNQEVAKTISDAAQNASATTQDKTSKPTADVVNQVSSALNSAASSLNAKFDRPDNVSCSFSFLDWHETSDVFGRRVANDYIAIQVNIRNLDKDNEFLIHDVQVAVDTGLSPQQFGRFQTSRDKLIVRSVAQRGQSEDRRNLILNTLQMLGNMGAAASTAITHSVGGAPLDTDEVDFANNFSTAVAIFQGPFITGFANIFPDHTIEHINHINDLSFSASSTSKTIVPTRGSVPLVTFMKEKPTEQLPYSRCGTSIKYVYGREHLDFHYNKDRSGNDTGSGEDESNDTNKSDGTNKGHRNKTGKDDPGSVKNDFCRLDDEDTATTNLKTHLDPDFYTKPLHYKKWNAAALRVLEARTFVVISGIHIQEMSNNPSVDRIDCPRAGDNSVDLSQANSAKEVPCTISGSRLDKDHVASVKLQKDKDSFTETFEPAADGKSGTIKIKTSDFDAKTGDYELFLTDTQGHDIDTHQKISFAVRKPTIGSVAYAWDPAKKTLTATLTGTSGGNLDRIKRVSIYSDDASSFTPLAAQQLSDATTSSSVRIATFTLTNDQITALKGKTVKLQYTTLDSPDGTPVKIAGGQDAGQTFPN